MNKEIIKEIEGLIPKELLQEISSNKSKIRFIINEYNIIVYRKEENEEPTKSIYTGIVDSNKFKEIFNKYKTPYLPFDVISYISYKGTIIKILFQDKSMSLLGMDNICIIPRLCKNDKI